jgi:leader peptidase (prepilin peptidase)/N-methyltransferase
MMVSTDAALLLAAPIIGSFLGVLIDRLPRGESVVFGRSFCRHCSTPLGPRDLAPIVSWLASRGRCRYCGGEIDPALPMIEATALAVAAFALWPTRPEPPWAGAAFGWILMTIAWIDARHGIIPNALSLSLVLSGLSAAVFWDAVSLWDRALGSAAGFGAFAIIAHVHLRLRGREGLGAGDAKLIAGIGAWLGWRDLTLVVIAATVFALLAAARDRSRRARDEATFGPALAAAAWLVWLSGGN